MYKSIYQAYKQYTEEAKVKNSIWLNLFVSINICAQSEINQGKTVEPDHTKLIIEQWVALNY